MMAIFVSLRKSACALMMFRGGSSSMVTPVKLVTRCSRWESASISLRRMFTNSTLQRHSNGTSIPRMNFYSTNGPHHRPSISAKTCRRFYYGEISRQRPPDTNVVKDVLLYENSKFTFHRVMGMFAVAQFTFWIYLAHFAYTEMRVSQKAEISVYGEKGAPEDKKKKFSFAGLSFHLGSPYWKYGMTIFCFGMGSLIMSAVMIFSSRNVHRLILRRGGQKCTVIPFGFFGRLGQRFTVPLTRMSCLHSRDSVKSNLPIKVKGRLFFYLLDKRGKFYNAKLFDFTAGMKRVID
ncbi:transmembrane protein 223-like [Ptychodera flava]|uniref:transmembrane protein 223-like n=1 Tax=Ptychodera flava TaxID=63121 RepID=UPI003969C829